MSEHESSRESGGSWGGTLAGVLPFLLIGLALVIHEIPHDWSGLDGLRSLDGGVFLIAFLVAPAIGFGVGWMKGFPRWSYPYAGQGVIFGLYISVASTPGIQIFGFELFGRQMWGWRACAPMLAAAGVALLVLRSPRSFTRLFTNVWEDWTLLTFAMFGFMPLIAWIAFDGVDRAYSLVFMVLVLAVTTAAAGFYLRAAHTPGRVAALAAGILAVMVVAAVGPTLYWRNAQAGWVDAIRMLVSGLVTLAFMFSPTLIGLARYLVKAEQPG